MIQTIVIPSYLNLCFRDSYFVSVPQQARRFQRCHRIVCYLDFNFRRCVPSVHRVCVKIHLFPTYYTFCCRPRSVVYMPSGYGLDGPGIESRWERDFPYLSRPVLGPTQPPVQRVPGLSWGYRAAGA